MSSSCFIDLDRVVKKGVLLTGRQNGDYFGYLYIFLLWILTEGLNLVAALRVNISSPWHGGCMCKRRQSQASIAHSEEPVTCRVLITQGGLDLDESLPRRTLPYRMLSGRRRNQ